MSSKLMLMGSAVTGLVLCVQALAEEDYQTLSDQDSTLTLDVPAGVVWTNTTPIPATVTTIIKIGGGEACYVPLTNTTFTGDITIRAGYLSGLAMSFGKPASITVETNGVNGAGGAWLLLDEYPTCYTFSNRTSIPFWNTKIKLCGKGPDGNGAFQRYHAHCDRLWDCLAADIELTGDTTVLNNTRWGITGSTFNMNGHTLTVRLGSNKTHGGTARFTDGLNFFELARNGTTTIKNPGPVVMERGGTYYTPEVQLEGTAKLVDAADSTGTIASNLSVTVCDKGRCNIFSGNASTHHDFPIHFLGSSTLRFNGAAYFDGPISVDGSRLDILSYTKEDNKPHSLWGGLSAPTGSVAISKDYHLNLELLGGETPRTNHVASFYHRGTSMCRGAATVTIGDHETYVVTNRITVGGSGGVSAPAWMVVRDDARLIDTTWSRSAAGRHYVGYESLAGVLCVEGNAVVSNTCMVGDQGPGAVYQTGGSLYMQANGDNSFLSNNGHLGYYLLADGYFWTKAWFNIGTGSTRAHFIQRGGRADLAGATWPVRIGWNNAGYGTYAQYGGTSVWRNYAVFSFASYTPTAVDIAAAITVSGQDTLMDFSQSQYRSLADGGIMFCASTNSLRRTTACVNVNDGGTLRIGQIYRGQVIQSGSSPAWSAISNLVAEASLAFVNANGGVIKASRTGDFFLYDATDHRTREPNRFTVYEKGIVFDTDSNDVTIHMPIERPFGRGIARVTLGSDLTDVSATNLLIGSTSPSIADATGRGADVIMAYDERTRRATNVIVNAHGFGFSATPVVRFRKTAWSSGNFEDCTVETVDFDDPAFVHGGFTKRGAGTLTLYATNTWGGATRLEGGTLAFAAADGMPQDGTVEVTSAAAAALTASSAPLLTADTFRASGIVITEADTLDAESADWKRMKKIATFANPLTAVPAVSYRNTDGTTPAGMSGWGLVLRDGGRTLCFGHVRGLAILLR